MVCVHSRSEFVELGRSFGAVTALSDSRQVERVGQINPIIIVIHAKLVTSVFAHADKDRVGERLAGAIRRRSCLDDE